ncbi:MAG: single-stranded-DNA-specific exonuclease RecJ, partial [Clostridia bacterium]
MNINIIERTKYTDEQVKLINEISLKFRIDKEVAKLLISRNICSIEEAEKFLFVSNDSLYDPYLLSGMKEFVERLTTAIDNQETIVVYGDYDADGICGAYILTQALLDLGANAIPYIPNRSEGYGLNIQAI